MENLEIIRRFATSSKLHRYLAYKCPGFVQIKKTDYTLYEILLAMKKVISSDKLFDPHNPYILVCDDYMEDALEVKAIHISEIRDYILKQMFIVDENQTATSDCSNTSVFSSIFTPPTTVNVPSWGSTSANAVLARMKLLADPFDTEGHYTMTPELLDVLRTVEGVNPQQTVFHYREITKLMCQYVLANKATLFDLRNIRTCFVENDPLGKAFGVKVFARCQVLGLLRSKLHLVPPSTTTPLPTQEETCAVLQERHETPIQEQSTSGQERPGTPIPKEPTSQQETPSSPLPIESTSQQEESSTPLREIPHDRPSSPEESTLSDESSVFAQENFRTLERDTYIVEYEVDNGTDNEKTPDDDSDIDSDIDNVQINSDKDTPIISDGPNCADLESTTDMEVDVENLCKNDKTSNCLTCKETIQGFARYCSMCWKDRKQWIPAHDKPKRRKLGSQTRKPTYESSHLTTNNNPCTICYINPKNAAFIHGQSSHQICCYSCAKKIIKKKQKCPVCRRKIEKITKHFNY